MKKILMVSLIATLGATTAAIADNNSSKTMSQPGFYVGLSGGLGLTNWQNLENTNVKFNNTTIHNYNSHNNNGFVSRVFVGYDFNKYFAVATGYSYFFTDANIDIVKNGQLTNTGDIQTMAFDVIGKGSVPITCDFSLFAKLGLDYLMTRNPLGTINNTNLVYGAGVDYHITSNVAASFEWLRLNGDNRIAHIGSKYQPATDSFLVGIRYKFT